MATNAELVTQLYIGYYDRAPDPVGLQYWIGRLDAGVPLVDVANSFAASPEAKATYPYFLAPDVLSPDDFLSQVYLNIFGRAIDTGPGSGLEYYGAKLAGGESPGEVLLEIIQNAVTNTTPGNTDAAFLANKVAVGLDWAAEAAANPDQTYQADGVNLTTSAMTSAHGVIDGVTADPATVAEGEAETQQFFDTGQTFTLTDAPDQIPGLLGSKGTTDNSHNDTIIAGTGNGSLLNGNNLGSGDVIDGGAGQDILKIFDTSLFGQALAPMVQNVETFQITSNGPFSLGTQLDMSNTTGVNSIVDMNSRNAVTFDMVQGPADLSMIGSSGHLTVDFDTDVDLGDTLNVNFDGAHEFGNPSGRAYMDVNGSDASIATLQTINLTSMNHDSYVDLDVQGPVDDAMFTTMNVDGDAGLRLAQHSHGFDNLTTINDNLIGGSFGLDIRNNDNDVTFNGHAVNGDTWLGLGDGMNSITFGDGDNHLWAGDGNNTVVGGTGTNWIDLGTGDNNVTTGGSDADGWADIFVDGGNNTISTGSGDDDVSIGDGGWSAGNFQNISTGAGDDDIWFNNQTFTTADVVDGGDGNDVLDIDATQYAQIAATNNVQHIETLEIDDEALSPGHLASDLLINGNELPTGMVNLIIDGDLTHNGFNVTVENIGGTIELKNGYDQSGAGIFTLLGTSSDHTDTIIVDQSTTISHGQIGDSGANDMSQIDFNLASGVDFTVENLAVNDDVSTISFTGDSTTSIDLNNLSGSGGLMDTLDLSNFEGTITTNASWLNSDLSHILVGNLLDASNSAAIDSTINVAPDTGAGSAQAWVFGTTLDGDLAIGGFNGVNHGPSVSPGAGLNADILDVSALGVHSLADLTFDDSGTNLVITSSAFDGSITLVGIQDQTDLTAADFNFA